ncbi:MAG: class I SAM-dependent methyltransferase [Verrucomicrobiaceae bacterium]
MKLNPASFESDRWPIGVADEKMLYSKNWKESACNIKRQGCYAWMCDQVDNLKPRKILEMGCGTGESTEALFRHFGAPIISIEENPDCIKRAGNLLQKHGFDSEGIYRIEYRQFENNRHCLIPSQRLISTSKHVSLVQGDILVDDPELLRFIESQAPYDLITVWLIGTFMMRKSCVNLDGMRCQSPREYSLRVQNRMYEIAHRMLTPGGILQVVDRGEPPQTEDLLQAVFLSHRDQASVTDLCVRKVTWKVYKEVDGKRGISLVDSKLGRKSNEMAVVSIISEKPKA